MYKKKANKQTICMFTLIIRAIICYLLVLVVFRLMGKRQIGEMQPFELVLTLIIADLATIPMSESAIPTLHGIVPLLTLVVVHFFLTFFSKKSQTFSQIVNGKPVIIINEKGIDYKAIESLDITVEDIFEAIRGQGYFSLSEIEFAIMETNGNVSVLPKSENTPLTNGDVGNKKEEATIPVTLISEGKIMKSNLKTLNLKLNDINKILKKNNLSSIKNILVCTIDKNGVGYIQENYKKSKEFNYKLVSQNE